MKTKYLFENNLINETSNRYTKINYFLIEGTIYTLNFIFLSYTYVEFLGYNLFTS